MNYKILLSFLFSCFFSFVYANTIEVCSSCTVSSIKQAIKLANDGDTIIVKAGVYKEHDIEIKKSIKLIAEEGAIIDGENKGEIVLVQADNVTVDGFEIINVGNSTIKDFAAIRIQRVNNFTIQNLIIRNPFFAIYLQAANEGIIRNNIVYGEAKQEYNAGNGIHMWKSSNNIIEGNQLFRMRDGIYCEFSDENLFKDNISKDNIRYALHFMFCHYADVTQNTFYNNGAGIAVMYSKHMKMYENTMRDNWGAASYGVLLKEVVDCEIHHNDFHRNTTAINIEGGSRIKYYHNDFLNNGWAINSRGGNYHNDFVNNNFINNSFDVAFTGKVNNNTFNGNYWSDYTGYDLDKDGVGDVPYSPVKLFNYLVNKSPEAIILLRSMFVDIVEFAEKVSPVFTPEGLQDETPSMKMIIHD